MKYASQSILTYAVIIVLTAGILGCEESTLISDTAIQEDGQVSRDFQQSVVSLKNDDDIPVIEGEYIVILEDQFIGLTRGERARQVDQISDGILSSHGISKESVIFRYRHTTQGFSAKLSDDQVEALKRDSRVAHVRPNVLHKLGVSTSESTSLGSVHPDTTKQGSQSTIQSVPWGVLRVGGPMQIDFIGKRAWVMDTGIDLTHPDLNVDVNNSVSFIPGEGPNDGDGHGTHVAGIIAATGNTTNVVGVAPGVPVVAVKVCFDEPPAVGHRCPINSLLAGIEHVEENVQSGDFVNKSLWGPIDPVWDNAVLNAADSGVRFTLIAGNNAANAANFSPGRVNHPNVRTMSAYDDNDIFAPFSNFGNPPVDYGEPGVDVPSLWRNGGTATSSGTSMAAPHVAGLLLACGEAGLDTDGTVSNDPAPPADPIAWGFRPSFVSNVTQVRCRVRVIQRTKTRNSTGML